MTQRVAVVGAGRWGIHHVEVFHRLGALAAVVDPEPGAQKRVQALAPDVDIAPSLEVVLDDPDIAGVVVATPAETHLALAEQALKAGKDVLVEKPLALTARDAEDLLRAAQEGGRILAVGHLLLFHPAVRWMRLQLDEGALGQVVRIETERLNLGRARRVENVLWSFAPHDFSLIHHLLGREPVAAWSTGQSVLQPAIEDHVHTEIAFEGGTRAHVHVSWQWPERVRRTTVIGTRGFLQFDELSGRVVLRRRGIGPALEPFEEGSLEPELESVDLLESEARAFLESMEDRQEPVNDARNGFAVVRLLELATEALHGRVLRP